MNINTVLNYWVRKQFKLMNGKITLKEYKYWKANLPDSKKEDYVPNIINKKQINYDKYIAEIQARNDITEITKKIYQDFYVKAPNLSNPKNKKIATKKEAIRFYT